MRFLRSRFQSWLSKRIPASHSVTLNQRNLFILPSKAGVIYLLVAVLVWILGTNYHNNLALACTYFMFALFVVAIFHTFSNLSGLRLTALSAQPAFAGKDSSCGILLTQINGRSCHNLQLCWPCGCSQSADVHAGSQTQITLFFKTVSRGYCRPGRILVESVYPLGILRCWTWVDLDVQALVYPAPIDAGPLPEDAVSSNEGESVAVAGSEDFHDLKAYQDGDSLKHIAWKQYAREQGLFTKNYCDYRTHQMWLRWESLPSLDREARLARLCDWVLQVSRTDEVFGLCLPGVEIPVSSGLIQREKALEALALFELEQSDFNAAGLTRGGFGAR